MDFFLEVSVIKYLLCFLISFVVIYLFYLVFVIFNKKKNKSIFDTNQASIFINLNKIDRNSIDKKVFVQVLSICNSFILSIVFTFAIFPVFDNFILSILLSFLLLIILILFVYKIVGLFFRKKV